MKQKYEHSKKLLYFYEFCLLFKSLNKNATRVLINGDIYFVENECVLTTNALTTLGEVKTLSKVLSNFWKFTCFMIVKTTNLLRQRLFSLYNYSY